MKIAYVLYPDVIISNKSNGIRSQAETWAKVLSDYGHKIDLVNNWGNYNWKEYDVIHIFGGGRWAEPVTRRLSLINPQIVISPIVDPSPHFNYKKATLKNKISRISNGIISSNHLDYGASFNYVKKVLVRSNFESLFIKKVYNVPNEKISLIRLTYSDSCLHYEVPLNKESFCLHISSISQPRKNVLRLIEAAKTFNFELVLAGNPGSDEQFAPLKKAIGEANNIRVLGFIPEEEKTRLYKSASVFALPSINEGVGIVALDAAYYGCNILITNIPGPKEYYHGMCVECNPFSIESIGHGVLDLLNGRINYQPELSEFVSTEYSIKNLCKQLTDVYTKL